MAALAVDDAHKMPASFETGIFVTFDLEGAHV
jgi:hypothetical protein